jgi:TetR/AcrR family tetracycline transcriptional repressor
MKQTTPKLRRSHAPLTRSQVVAAAIGLLDHAGLDGFTMRALAARLGTYPTTIYWHAGTRSEVLALVSDDVLALVDAPDPGTTTWRVWLASVARSYRQVLHVHPAMATYFASRIVVSPPSLPLIEKILSVLQSAGFQGERLAHAYNTYVGSLVGWVSVELAQGPVGEDWQQGFAATVQGLSGSTEFPAIAAHHAALADSVFTLRWHAGRERPMDDSFEFALHAWLAGLDALRGHDNARSQPRYRTSRE